MPRAVPALLLGALLGVVPALPGPAQAETVDQTYAMPGTGSVTVKGHGYGHGHGMSQYGAEGAARQGLTYEQIAEFYYPKTRWGRVKGRIRVQITADTTDDLVVLPRKGLAVRDLTSQESWVLPATDATRWRVARIADGRNRVNFYRDGRWRAWRTAARARAATWSRPRGSNQAMTGERGSPSASTRTPDSAIEANPIERTSSGP